MKTKKINTGFIKVRDSDNLIVPIKDISAICRCKEHPSDSTKSIDGYIIHYRGGDTEYTWTIITNEDYNKYIKKYILNV